jgi:hypothetical protein
LFLSMTNQSSLRGIHRFVTVITNPAGRHKDVLSIRFLSSFDDGEMWKSTRSMRIRHARLRDLEWVVCFAISHPREAAYSPRWPNRLIIIIITIIIISPDDMRGRVQHTKERKRCPTRTLQ